MTTALTRVSPPSSGDKLLETGRTSKRSITGGINRGRDERAPEEEACPVFPGHTPRAPFHPLGRAKADLAL
jgi:hypothetical protein